MEKQSEDYESEDEKQINNRVKPSEFKPDIRIYIRFFLRTAIGNFLHPKN